MAIVGTNLWIDPRAVGTSAFTTEAAGGALTSVVDFPGDINTAVRHTRSATGARGLVEMPVGSGGAYTPSTSYRVRMLIRSSATQTVTIQSRPTMASASGAVTMGTIALAVGVNVIDVTGTTAANAATSTSGWGVFGNTGPAIGVTTDVTQISIQRTSDSYTAQYFDGMTQRTGVIVFEWSGVANASTSVAYTSYPAPAKKMWFGQEGHFQWVPQPGAGMEVGHSATYESISYQNSRFGSHASKQNYKTYDMNFPVQEAHGDDGLDVFQKYANGYWRDPDIFPLFFTDPMNWQNNLFPPNWASPGMYDGGWDSPVWDRPRYSINLAQNPSVTPNDAGWTRDAFTNNTASVVASSMSTRGWAYRTTATGGTAPAPGAIFGDYTDGSIPTGPYVPIEPGRSYTFRVLVEASIARDISMRLTWVASSTGTTTQTATAVGVGVTGAYVQRTAVAPTNAPYDRVEVATYTSSSVAPGEWLQFSDLTVSPTEVFEPMFFDGYSTDAYWLSVAGASVSVLNTRRQAGTVTPESSSLNLGIPNRTLTLPITQRLVNGVARTNSTSVEETQYPYTLIPVPPGYRLWVSCAWARSAALVDLAVDYYQNDNYSGVPNQSTTIPPSGVTQAFINPRVTTRDGDYAKIYFKRTDAGAVDVTLRYMIAQLWPEGVTPPNWTTFPEGMGHRGLKFTETPTTESYVLIDPYRQVPVHYKGMSAQLIEAQENG